MFPGGAAADSGVQVEGAPVRTAREEAVQGNVREVEQGTVDTPREEIEN